MTDGEKLYGEALSLLQDERDEEAIELLRRGVDLGDASCQALLGSMYAEGRGPITRNPFEARRLFDLSAAQYNRHGTYIYGIILYFGRGLPRDEKKGLRMVKRAALMGVVDAQAFLSQYYGQKFFQGTKAVAWLLIAAENGHAGAREHAEKLRSIPPGAQELAGKLNGAIATLNGVLVHLNPDAAVKRLEEMVDEI